MKKLIRNCIWFLLAAAIVLTVNLVADPANLTQNEIFFDRMLSVMQEGHNILYVADYKDRLFQQRAAVRIDRPDTILFGSSRIQQIDSSICGDKIWNAGVSGATTQDICGLYQVFLENGKIGDRVIIGIDLWTLDGSYYDARASLYLAEPLARFRSAATGETVKAKNSYSSLSSVRELTSLSYFQSSLKYLTGSNSGKRLKSLTTTDEFSSAYGILHSDCSYSYPHDYIYSSQADVEQRVYYAREAVVAPTLEWEGIDPELAALFEALCESITENGSELVLLISPIHPLSYYDIESNGGLPALTDTEDFLHDLANRVGATVIGSFDPYANKCDYSDFMDALHITYATTERLWSEALQKNTSQ